MTIRPISRAFACQKAGHSAAPCSGLKPRPRRLHPYATVILPNVSSAGARATAAQKPISTLVLTTIIDVSSGIVNKWPC